MNNILLNIKAIRLSKRLSQEYMAESLKITQTAYSLWEKGKRELTYNNLLKIADVLNENVVNIITYPDVYVLSDGNSGQSTKAVLQIELDQDKKEQVLKLVFGERCAEMIIK